MSWCTIESDPGVFTELVSMLGVKDVAVEEIYSLDQVAEQREKSYGLIFLFKWQQETDERTVIDPSDISELFFAKQTVQNACATQAILSVLLNADGVQLSDELSEFKSFSSVLDAEMRGDAIGSSEQIREVHNSFARPEPFITEEVKAARSEKEDAYHFVAYVPFRGSVYEIDGLKRGPIHLGDVDSDWLSVARPAIEARMSKYSSSETSFALLSIKQKRSALIELEISALTERKEALTGAEDSSAELEQINNQLFHLRSELEDEQATQERQREENVRRRHNYIPFIMVILRALAQQGSLQPMIDRATARAKANREVAKKL